MKNIIIVDSLEKLKLVKASESSTLYNILVLADIVYDFKLLNDIEMEELFFYFDESMKNKELTQEIARILEVRQYYILNANSDDTIDEKIKNARVVTYGDMKAGALRKNIDLMYQNKISQMARWLLFKHRSADANSIRRLLLNRATPVVLGIIADAEKKILEFEKEEYIRVAVEYIYKDNENIDDTTGLARIHNFKLLCRTKFKKEHEDELGITLATLRDSNIEHIIKDFKRGTEEMKPYAPLTTTRLLRSCFYLFDIDPVRTISICEELCNGINVDGSKVKLITSPFTEGQRINDEAILQINKVLISKYGVNYVLPSRRTFDNNDEEKFTKEEAVRPLNFTEKFFPARIEGKIPALHYEVYKFIFYRTLATQMKNSIYDASKLIVEVNDIELIAHAHKLEFDGWERLDGYRQKVSETDEELKDKEIVFPKDLFIGKVLKPVIVGDYNTTDKNPPRYGKGRLLTILVESKLCRPESAHLVIDSMEKAGLIIERQHMIHPQEIGMIVDAVVREYAPSLREQELLKTFEENIIKVSKDELNPDEVMSEYEVLKNDLEIAIGYEENNNEPDEWMIEKAKKVALFHGDILTDDNPIFFNKQLILNYLNQKENDLEKIGRCPECKKEQVVEDSLSFKCIDRDCKFVLYKNGKDDKPGGISGFFNNFKKSVPVERYKDILGILLKSQGKLYFEDLKKKSGETFGAYVKLQKDKTYNKWQLSLSFPKSKKTKISDSLNAKNVLGDYLKKIVEIKEVALPVEEEKMSCLLDIEQFSSHIGLFNQSGVSTTTVEIKIIKESSKTNILSISEFIEKALTKSEVRFKQYEQDKNEIVVLLVGEYMMIDLIDLGISDLTFNSELKVKIRKA